jgi:transposase
MNIDASLYEVSMKYSIGFRNGVLRKVLPPENGSITSVAREYGISPNEKLQLLLESKQLSDEHLGEWLRQHRLHTEHLTLWQQELEGIVTDKQQDLQDQIKQLKKENQKLKKERERDKAAMAEALALLTLKKNWML